MEPVITAALVSGAANLIGNAVNTGLSVGAQNYYMNKWGSPEAQMAHMRNAGINPYGAAGNISGAAGDSPVGLGLSTPNYGDMMANLSNSHMNPTVEENTNANTNKTNEEAKGQEISNEINENTKTEQMLRIIADAGYSDAQRKMAEEMAKFAPEMAELSIEEIESRINEYNAKVLKISHEVESIDKQIELMEDQRKEIRVNMRYLHSAADLNNARKLLVDVEKQIADFRLQRDEIELGRYTAMDDAPWYAKKYAEIASKNGKESAEAWFADMQGVIDTYNESLSFATSKGQSSGSTPVMLENWNNYANIVSAIQFEQQSQEALDSLNAYYSELVALPEKNGDLLKEVGDQVIEAEAAVRAAAARVKEAEKAFKRGMEFAGYRDPNKFYADEWLQVGKIVVDAGTRIAAAVAFGKSTKNVTNSGKNTVSTTSKYNKKTGGFDPVSRTSTSSTGQTINYNE